MTFVVYSQKHKNGMPEEYRKVFAQYDLYWDSEFDRHTIELKEISQLAQISNDLELDITMSTEDIKFPVLTIQDGGFDKWNELKKWLQFATSMPAPRGNSKGFMSIFQALGYREVLDMMAKLEGESNVKN